MDQIDLNRDRWQMEVSVSVFCLSEKMSFSDLYRFVPQLHNFKIALLLTK